METMRAMSTPLRSIILAIVLLPFVVGGCSSGRSKPLPEFESVAVVSILKPADGLEATKDRDSVEQGGSYGKKGGAAAGAATSLLCGPWFVLCFPLLTAGGAFAGSVAGGVAGSVVDTLEAWPKEQAEQAKIILADIDERRDFFVEMRDGLARSVPEGRKASTEEADALIHVGPHSIELVQDEPTHLAIRMTAVLTAEWNRDKRTPRTDKREYIYQTDVKPVEEWLDEDGAAFNAGFTECIQMLVNSMAWDLRQSTR